MRCERLLVLLALLLGALQLRGSVPDSLAPVESAPVLRPFDAEAIAALQQDPALAYENDIQRAPSAWDRFKAMVEEWLARLVDRSVAGLIGSNLYLVISAALLLLGLYLLSRGGLRNVLRGTRRNTPLVQAQQEDLGTMDLDARLLEAESRGDLRYAIRLRYLRLLRDLQDQGLIQWHPDHTDHDVQEQLQDPGLRARFAHAALIFQWVWYGHAALDADRYARLQRPFGTVLMPPVP